jgi:hypothetical protein
MDNLETNLSEKTQKHYKEENKNLESIETKCMYVYTFEQQWRKRDC